MEKVNCEKYTNLLQFLKRNDAIIFYMSRPLACIYLQTCKSQIFYRFCTYHFLYYTNQKLFFRARKIEKNYKTSKFDLIPIQIIQK